MSNSNDNHTGNMQTPEDAALQARVQARIDVLKALKAEVERKTLGDHMMSVIGCALFAVCLMACATAAVGLIDAIIKIVRAW